MLAWLTKLLESVDTPIGTVVHIGAGVGAELPLYHDLNCDHVLAIEPDSTLFKKLKAKAKRFDNVSVQQAWIADNTAERSATVFTNPRFNSLLPADKTLLTHFPNVKSTETLTVQTKSFDELVTSNVKKADEKLNVLVLEVQGFETLLCKNSSASALQLFNWIVVRTSDEALFEGGANTSEMKQCLTKQGFELRFSERNQLPFVEQYYQLNSSAIELKILKPQLETLNNQCIAEKEKLNEVNQLLLQKEALNTQLEEKLTKSNEQVVASQASLDNQQKKSKQESEDAQQTTEEKIQEIESLNLQIGELSKRAQTAQAQAEITAVKNTEITQNIENIKKSEQEKNEQIRSLQVSINESKHLITQNEAVNNQLQEELTKSIELYTDSRVSLDELKRQLNQERARAKEKTEKIEALNTQIRVLTESYQTTNSELESAKANLLEQRQQIENFKQSEQEKNGRISSQQDRMDDLMTQLDVVKQAFEESQNKLQYEAHWHQENKKWAESQKEQLQELKQELEGRQKTSDLALKLQTKAQVDLEELRQKYQTKHHNEQKLVALIKDLREKLQQASKFYFYLQEHYPNLTEFEEQNQFFPVENSAAPKLKVENKVKTSAPSAGRKRSTKKS
jgi:FkbM family methyltransferase